MLGVSLILASTLAYNGSAVLLAAETRRHPEDSGLLLAVGRRASGAFAISLNLLGWGLEVAALTYIPLTLARILNAAGLAFLLGLTRWALKEPLGYREVLGVGLVALGMAAVGLAPPRLGGTAPDPGRWAVLFAVLGPGLFLPCAMRVLRRPVGYVPAAVAAGLAYALSGILNKGVAEAVRAAGIVPLVLLTGCVAALGIRGFAAELDALKLGRASVVVPVVMGLHTLVPVAVAPLLFGEVWPSGLLSRLLLGGGIFLTFLGMVCLSGSPGRLIEGRKGRPGGGG